MGESKINNTIFKEELINNEGYIVGVDELQRIRIAIINKDKIDSDVKVSNLVKLVVDIDSLPMDDNERILYRRDIANIYQIGLNEGEDVAIEYAKNIKRIIERNLILQRKKQLFLPCIIGFACIIIISSIDILSSLLSDYYYPIVFGSIGGMLSVITQNNKLNIDYKIDKNLLGFESTKLILISIITSIIGCVAIKSKFILGNLQGYNLDYFIFLMYIACGYSQTFIPNLLKNIETSSLKSEEEN